MMKRIASVVMAGCFAGIMFPAFGGTVITANLPANTAIININAVQDGASGHSGDQSLWYQPFFAGGATQLLECQIQPGAYNFRIVNPADAAQLFPALTAAQTNQIFSAWSYNSPWVTDYLVFDGAAATNTSLPQIFDGSPDPSSYDDVTAAYNGAVAGGYYDLIRTGPAGRNSTTFTNTYTTATAETLIFAVPDYGLSDNAGGVSVLISPATGNPNPVVKIWNGSADSDWFNPANWSPAGVPTAEDAISISSGTINLTSPVIVSNVLTWSGGAISGDALTIATNGVLNLTGSGAKYIENTLTNAGTVNWLDGQVIPRNDNSRWFGEIENAAGGAWNIQCNQEIYDDYTGPAAFQNAGTVVKTAGTGTTTLNLPFDNTGTVLAQSGTISLYDGGVIESNFTAAAGAAIQFGNGSFNYRQTASLTGPGAIQFTGGTMTLSNNVSPILQLAGGTLALGPDFQGGTITNLTISGSSLTGTNTVNGTLNWSGGTITGPLEVTNGAMVNWGGGTAGSTVNIEAGGVLNLTGGTEIVDNVLTNAGTVNWLGGNFSPYNNNGVYQGAVENLAGGLWDIQCDQQLYNGYSGPAYFHNAGTVEKTAGTGTTTISVAFNNAGAVVAQSGTINFSGGGIVESNFTAASGAAIHFSGGSFSYGVAPVLTGPGAIQLTGGTLTLLDNTIPGLQMVGGTVTLSPGFQQGVITNLTLGGSSVLQGTNAVAGTFNCGDGVAGALTVLGGGTLNWSGGTITGPLEVTNGAMVNWSGGTAGSTVNIEASGVLNLTGNSTMYIDNVLTNAGTVNWLGGNFCTPNYNGGYAGAVENLAGGLWNIQCDQQIYDNYGGGSPYFHNAGTVEKTAGTGTTTISIPFNNAGAVVAQSGTINFSGGGIVESNFTAASGAAIHFSGGSFSYGVAPVLTGPGAIQLTGGTLALLDNTIPGLQMVGGTLVLGSNFQDGVITNLAFGGTLSGNYMVAGTLTLGGGDPGVLTVSNGAALTWSGGNVGGIILSNGATMNWSGGTLLSNLDVVAGAVVNWSGGTAGSTVNIEASGVLNLTGNSTMYIDNVLTNAGTVNWLGGNFCTPNYNGGYAGAVENLAGGLWNIQCDQQIYDNYGGGSPYFHNAGTVEKTAGTGTTTISVAFNNDVGTLDVESGVVSFNQNNGYGQTDGTLQFGLNGSSHSGKVQIAGNVNFDGTLAAALTGGYAPQAGDTISLVTYGSSAGTFNNLNLPALDSSLAWQISYNATALQLGVVSNANSTAQITGTVTDNSAQAVANVTVFAYTTNVSGGIFLSTVTDAGGQYALSVTNGTWFVGLQGLPGRGYNPVANQMVMVSNANQTVDFSLQPYSLQHYTITTAVNPPGAGASTGGGTFANGAPATVSAAANTATLPYYFSSWTENGVFESASANYAFTVSRNRALTANFALPAYQLSAVVSPSGAGTVGGQGTFFYGTTNVLTANANYGYNFANWTENSVVLATTPAFTNIVTSNRVVTANFAEANPSHVVTTATSPANVAVVTGAGTYTNTQTVTITAPASVTLAPYIYTFSGFQLNGANAGGSATLSKTFSTLDPPVMNYVAVYAVKSIQPTVVRVIAGFTNAVQGGFTMVTNPVPAATNYQVTLQFDRGMDPGVNPLVVITNGSATVQPVVPPNGVWLTTSAANDTYRTPFITFSNGMDGAAWLQVSGAQDTLARPMAATNAAALVIDVTPPANPALALTASNSTSAQISWSGYSGPADLGGFRVYLSGSDFTSVAGLTPVTALGAGARSASLTGLSLDQPYYAAVAAVDQAGNSSPLVTPLPFTLTSSVPPPVTVQVTATGDDSAGVSWNGYDPSQLLGFSGFYLYYETSNFTSVAGLTPRQTLSAGARSAQVGGLDRTQTYHFAVVGYNVNDAFNPGVTTASWSDPYAGDISANTTIGGPGQPVVDILQSITVVNGATLTVPAGTTLRFAPGTGLTVQSGALFASGTALDPVVFTSENDQPGRAPAAGDWNGVTLENGASPSVLANLIIRYGQGLTLDDCAPTVVAFSAQYNAPAGLTLQNGATLHTSDALLEYNAIGAQQLGASGLEITNSVIQNNGTNALAQGGLNLFANQDWWGSADSATIAASLRGAVDDTGFLAGEPLLTPAIGTPGNVTQVGGATANLRLACRTATAMRLSEDSSFAGVFFAPFTNAAPFVLSDGGGAKTIFAQFRSVTGGTSAPVSLTLNYVTTGPAISSFNLAEGELLTRPLTVTGGATAALGVADVEFYVDGAGQGTNTGGNFLQWFDVRNLSVGTHRVELLARDTAGNIATLAHNVTVSPTPPPAPVITGPASDIVTDASSIAVSGTAEPFIPVRLFSSGTLVGTANAAADGAFSFSGVPLIEGGNQIIAGAQDSFGTAYSSVRNVSLDTIPPAQLVMNVPVYTPGSGLALTWLYPSTGKQASSFEVFWNPSPITDASQALGHTVPLSSMSTTVQGLATGDYYFYVVGYDALNHASPLSAPVTYHYDAVPPSFTISFDQASPVGVGTVHLVLTASEALSGMPTLTITPNGSSPSLVTLANSAVNTYAADINVTGAFPSGTATFKVAAADLAGNTFSGAPSGPALVIDVTPPAGTIATAPLPPVQVTNNTAVAVSLQLTEAPAAGTVPVLNFGPPTGSPVPVPLSGSDTNWTGTLALVPAMGSGTGHFTLSVTDALANVGHEIAAGEDLEIYNTPLPSPPGQPVHFEANSLAGGRIELTWSNVPLADYYRVYSDPGTSFDPPTTLVADNVTSNRFVDLPAADGSYRYVVTALRRGSEGTNSITRVAISDRVPPPAPIGVAAQLVTTGLQISWQPGAGETPDHYNVYRNGTLIRTVTTAAAIIDNPPRGTINYTVGADDAVGNEALSSPATIQMLVGAVNNLQALAGAGQATVLTWSSPDATAVGFNVYRNGVQQNNALLTGDTYTDSLPAGSAPVAYAVTALNATNGESAARSVTVYPVTLGLLVNAAGGSASGAPLTSYFDDYVVSITNQASAAGLPLQQLNVTRTAAGSPPLNLMEPANSVVPGGSGYAAELSVPCATNLAAQTVQVQAVQQTDSEGSSVVYQQSFDLPGTVTPGVMVGVSVNQLPLAGGLTPFNVQIYNRGYTPVYFVTARGNGSQPGDLYVSVRNSQGQEVSRTPFTGVPTGTTFYGSTGYLMIPAGSSTTLTVPDVLTPAALTNDTVTFQAVVSKIYDRLTPAGQQSSGPLIGSMQSGLAQTPYYGTAQTDRAVYSGDQPVIISGQALDRVTGQPVPNVPLRIGFATRGYHWYQDVTSDTNGDYSYTYNVTPGLAGTLTLWAAHPDVVDQLNQAQITIYRLYASPSSGDIRMSKNGALPFTISLFNPGDLPLTGFTSSFQAYEMQGETQVPITSLHGTNSLPPSFVIAPGQTQTVPLQLSADADAPDNAIVTFTLTSAEGASATFTGNVTLLPAVPIVTVQSPANGYVEVSLDRGGLVSRQVTIVNTGLEDLKGVSIIPPTNVTWMTVNLPAAANGTIPLPDLPVGATNSFTVVFTPPAGTDLGFFQDQLTIQGTNVPSGFSVPLYARVTSSQQGAIQFYVDDILGNDVPNATVRLRNTDLQVELPPVTTDINGLVTVSNLQEGDWSWQVTASGYSGNVGVTTVIPDQTVQTHSRLNKSLVTINFTVTPVPFSDTYDIQIEQTFETHVPIPVLVLTPVYQEFDNVTPGFQVTYVLTAKNEGLVQMTDLTIQGGQDGPATLTPLITYVPVLGAQQSVDIPMAATYAENNVPVQQGNAFSDCAGSQFGNGDLVGNFLAGADAFAKAVCPKDRTEIDLGAGAAAAWYLAHQAFKPAAAAAKFIGCLLGHALGGLGGLTAKYPGKYLPTVQLQQSIQQFQPVNAGCFIAGTRVLLADGQFKTIDRIKAGDAVRSGENRRTVATVVQTYERKDDTCREISFALPGQTEPGKVETTDAHLFWVDGQGWVAAAKLKAGDWLMNDHGQRVQITANRRLAGTHEVYTLKLRGDSAFYANGILVHDLCGAWTEPKPATVSLALPSAVLLKTGGAK